MDGDSGQALPSLRKRAKLPRLRERFLSLHAAWRLQSPISLLGVRPEAFRAQADTQSMKGPVVERLGRTRAWGHTCPHALPVGSNALVFLGEAGNPGFYAGFNF